MEMMKKQLFSLLTEAPGTVKGWWSVSSQKIKLQHKPSNAHPSASSPNSKEQQQREHGLCLFVTWAELTSHELEGEYNVQGIQFEEIPNITSRQLMRPWKPTKTPRQEILAGTSQHPANGRKTLSWELSLSPCESSQAVHPQFTSLILLNTICKFNTPGKWDFFHWKAFCKVRGRTSLPQEEAPLGDATCWSNQYLTPSILNRRYLLFLWPTCLPFICLWTATTTFQPPACSSLLHLQKKTISTFLLGRI